MLDHFERHIKLTVMASILLSEDLDAPSKGMVSKRRVFVTQDDGARAAVAVAPAPTGP